MKAKDFKNNGHRNSYTEYPADYTFSSARFYEQQVDEFGILTNFGEVF